MFRAVTMRRDRQLVNVSVTLIGLQDTAVAAHRPDTDGAAVSVRVGGALIWMHDCATVAKFADVWRAEDHSAARLPREPVKMKGSDPSVREPTVMVEAAGSPTAFATLLREEGRPSRMRVVLGRLAFDVRDLGAFRSTTAAFHRAADVAAEVFLDGRAHARWSRQATAAEIGGRAFISPVGSPYQRSVRARTVSAARIAPTRRPERGGPTR